MWSYKIWCQTVTVKFSFLLTDNFSSTKSSGLSHGLCTSKKQDLVKEDLDVLKNFINSEYGWNDKVSLI